jgi:hypothetical protein
MPVDIMQLRVRLNAWKVLRPIVTGLRFDKRKAAKDLPEEILNMIIGYRYSEELIH